MFRKKKKERNVNISRKKLEIFVNITMLKKEILNYNYVPNFLSFS